MVTITIQNFKYIKYLELKNLETINIIVGDNGVGKTSVLHAIHLLGLTGVGIEGFLFKYRNLNKKNLEYINATETLFNCYNLDDEIHIALKDSTSYEATINKIQASNIFDTLAEKEQKYLRNNNPNLQDTLNNINDTLYLYSKKLKGESKDKYLIHMSGILYVSPFNSEFKSIYLDTFSYSGTNKEISDLTRNRKINKLIEQLKLLDENVEDLVLLPDSTQETVPYIIFKGVEKAIPFYNLSGSLKTALTIFPILLNNKDQYILLDEFESSIYFKRLSKVLKSMYDIAKMQNHRIIIASHSSDIAKSIAYLDSKENKLDICAYYLSESRKEKGKIFATKYSSDTINEYIQNDYDIRGNENE